jgi:hypothetical protein
MLLFVVQLEIFQPDTGIEKVASHLSAEGGDHVLSNTEVHRTPVLLRLKIRAFISHSSEHCLFEVKF